MALQSQSKVTYLQIAALAKYIASQAEILSEGGFRYADAAKALLAENVDTLSAWTRCDDEEDDDGSE